MAPFFRVVPAFRVIPHILSDQFNFKLPRGVPAKRRYNNERVSNGCLTSKRSLSRLHRLRNFRLYRPNSGGSLGRPKQHPLPST